MNHRRMTVVAAALIGLASCSFIEVRPGADNVRVVNDSQIARCDLLGKTTVSAPDRVGLIVRDPEKVDADLVTLARNSAVNMEGDTVVPGERPRPGERVFSVYRCLR